MSTIFQIAVWTSGTYKKSGKIVKSLFGSNSVPPKSENINSLLFAWYQDKCDVIKPQTEKGFGYIKPLFLKRLTRIWEEYQCFNQDNTV
jgi:hypothetical protein